MASGSGKNQDGNQCKEPVGSEESNTAAAAAAEPPPPAPPSDRLHGSPEAGDRNPFAATAAEAAAAAQRKGKGIAGAAPSWRHDAVGKPPLPPRDAFVSRASEPKSAAGKPPLPPRASKSQGKKLSDAEVVRSGMVVRNKWKDMREGRMHRKEANAEMDQKDQPEGAAMQQEQRTGRRISRRLTLFFIILLLFAFLPTGTAFQRFKNLDKAAEALGGHVELQQLQIQLADEEAYARRVLWLAGGSLLTVCFILGELIVDTRQEARIPPAAPELFSGVTSSLVLAAIVVILSIVILRVIVRRA